MSETIQNWKVLLTSLFRGLVWEWNRAFQILQNVLDPCTLMSCRCGNLQNLLRKKVFSNFFVHSVWTFLFVFFQVFRCLLALHFILWRFHGSGLNLVICEQWSNTFSSVNQITKEGNPRHFCVMKIIVQFRIGNYIVRFYFRLLLYLFSLFFFFCLKHGSVWRAEGSARALFDDSRVHVCKAFLYTCMRDLYKVQAKSSEGSVVTCWA